jgi:hypothetical protein
MRRVNILNAVGFLVALLLVIGFGYAAFVPPKISPIANANQPDLLVSPSVLDFGEVRQQQSLTGEFELHNTFPVALTIGLIGKSCSCADAEVEPKRIEPNQKSTLKVLWKTGTRRDESRDQLVLVGTLEDEQKSTIQRIAKLKANVRPDYRLEPSELHFGPEGGTKTVRLIPDAAKDVKIKSVHTAAVGVTATLSSDSRSVYIEYSGGYRTVDKIDMLILTDSISDTGYRVRITFAN